MAQKVVGIFQRIKSNGKLRCREQRDDYSANKGISVSQKQFHSWRYVRFGVTQQPAGKRTSQTPGEKPVGSDGSIAKTFPPNWLTRCVSSFSLIINILENKT